MTITLVTSITAMLFLAAFVWNLLTGSFVKAAMTAGCAVLAYMAYWYATGTPPTVTSQGLADAAAWVGDAARQVWQTIADATPWSASQ